MRTNTRAPPFILAVTRNRRPSGRKWGQACHVILVRPEGQRGRFTTRRGDSMDWFTRGRNKDDDSVLAPTAAPRVRGVGQRQRGSPARSIRFSLLSAKNRGIAHPAPRTRENWFQKPCLSRAGRVPRVSLGNESTIPILPVSSGAQKAIWRPSGRWRAPVGSKTPVGWADLQPHRGQIGGGLQQKQRAAEPNRRTLQLRTRRRHRLPAAMRAVHGACSWRRRFVGG